MDQERPQHEKVRFRRDEITDLSALPSACDVPPLGRASIGRRFRRIKRVVAALVCVIALLVIAVYTVGAIGIGTERLQQEAEKAIERVAGINVDVDIGSTSITLDGSSFLALRVKDLSLTTHDGRPVVNAGVVRFGVRLWPLISGDVRLT
ncbi:MAG: hypothetical protein J0I86_08110, partial [Mesorhizobium sp.]|nr:hypothetical protein [Mesorhizobium sp.]